MKLFTYPSVISGFYEYINCDGVVKIFGVCSLVWFFYKPEPGYDFFIHLKMIKELRLRIT